MPLLRLASALIAASLAFAGAVPDAYATVAREATWHAYITPDEFMGGGTGGGSSGGNASSSSAAQQPSAGTDGAGSTQSDAVQVDGRTVPIPVLPGGTREPPPTFQPSSSTSQTPARRSPNGEGGFQTSQTSPPIDRAAMAQERMEKRMEGGAASDGGAAGMPVPALATMPEPAHSAAPGQSFGDDTEQFPPEAVRSIEAQIMDNPLPGTGAAHTVILVSGALAFLGSSLSRRWATTRERCNDITLYR